MKRKRLLKQYDLIDNDSDFLFHYLLNDTGLDVLDQIGIGRKYKINIIKNQKLSDTKDYLHNRDPKTFTKNGYFFEALYTHLLNVRIPMALLGIKEHEKRLSAIIEYLLDKDTDPVPVNPYLENLVLQTVQPKMFLWEMTESGNYKFDVPCSIGYTDNTDMYRLAPGGTRMLYTNFNELCTHDLIETARKDVYAKYPDEPLLDDVTPTDEIKEYIQNLIDDGRKVSISKYRTRINSDREITSSGYLQLKIENDDDNKYSVDLNSIFKMKIMCKDRVIRLSDGTELLRINDDYGIEIIEPKERPWYWKEK